MIAALLLAAAQAAASQAPAPEPVCVRMGDPPAGMAAWSKPVDPGDVFRPGTAVKLAMKDVATLRFAAPPAKAPVGGTYGTILPLVVSRAGTYRVALSEAAWLDVAQGSRLLPSIGHTHGPPCSGIRKIVSFRLRPGRYAVQVIGAPRPEGTLLVVRE